MHICLYGAMAIFILNKISLLEPKTQNRVRSAYHLFCTRVPEGMRYLYTAKGISQVKRVSNMAKASRIALPLLKTKSDQLKSRIALSMQSKYY